MKIRRRQLLGGASVMALALMAPIGWAQNSSQGVFFIVLTGLGSRESEQGEIDLIETFTRRPIPVLVVVDAPTEHLYSQDDYTKLKEIVRYSDGKAGVVELAVGHMPIGSTHRYFNLRDATDLRDRIAALVKASGASRDDITTILNLGGSSGLDPFAYRAAGFRVQIDTNVAAVSPSGTDAEPFDWGILRLSGGVTRSLADDPIETIAAFRETRGPHLLVLDVANLEASEALEHAENWASSLDIEITAGRLIPVRPRDYLLQGNPGSSKIVALTFDLGGVDELSDEILEFNTLLDEIQIPFSVISPTEPPSLSEQAGYCFNTDLPDSEPIELQGNCFATSTERIGTFESSPAEIILDRSLANQAPIGPRNDGRFHIQIGEMSSDRLITQLNSQPMTDGVIMVKPNEIDSRFRRLALQNALHEVKRDGQVNFTTIEGLRDALVASDPILKRFWSTRRRFPTPLPQVSIPNQNDRSLWMDDAELAWTFLQRFTRNDTGLCAGTVSSNGSNLVINNELTLWDVGSQIQATISANRLGLIGSGEATELITQSAKSIPTFEVGGLKLPSAMFDGATLKSVRVGFDACDTGRFLIALKHAVRHGLISLEFARSIFLRWDLSEIVADKRPFTITSKGFEDVSLSHCTHYIRSGFAFAGIEVESQLPKLSATPNGDERIRLLYKSAEMGHFGPEPAMLEAIEGHQSAESRYLCDVLFDAQLAWFERTGQIRCVSEVPIDRSPWFVYQGLRVDLPDEDGWIIRTVDSEPTDSSDAALEGSRIVCTKAIYLWATTYSHPFSEALLNLARERMRLPGLGHASGLHEGELELMRGYSDVNTNGIILTAIAHLLD